MVFGILAGRRGTVRMAPGWVLESGSVNLGSISRLLKAYSVRLDLCISSFRFRSIDSTKNIIIKFHCVCLLTLVRQCD